MSPSSVRSGTQASAVLSSTHSPAGLFTPVLSTGERGSGLAVPARPSVSMRSTFPASEPGSALSSPASPVATSSNPSASTPNAPALCVTPRGIPTSTGFGGSPAASFTTRLSVGVVM